jgi:hypothetical protein
MKAFELQWCRDVFLIGEVAMRLAETLNNKDCVRPFGQIKRKYRRVGISGFVGTLADGTKVIEAIVENISTSGFKFTNLPESFSAEKHTYIAVISGEGKHYKVLAKPCWRKKEGENINIGFKILDAPWEWVEFILNRIPEMHKN